MKKCILDKGRALSINFFHKLFLYTYRHNIKGKIFMNIIKKAPILDLLHYIQIFNTGQDYMFYFIDAEFQNGGGTSKR